MNRPQSASANAGRWASLREKRSRCLPGPVLFHLYRLPFARPFVRRILEKLEGGDFFSLTLREILRKQYGVSVGMYSYGDCLRPGYLPRGTEIGNYCSFASGLSVHRRNHPMDRLSMHPFFYNGQIGPIPEDTIEANADRPLKIGHDVWIGTGAIILPNCSVIGNGSVIGAGSVVTGDVPPFCIVAGNPARLLRKRFLPDVEKAVMESEWWLRPLSELVEGLPFLVRPATVESVLALAERIKALPRGVPSGRSRAKAE